MEHQPPRVFPIVLCAAACLLAVAQFLSHRTPQAPIPLAIGQAAASNPRLTSQPNSTVLEPSTNRSEASDETESVGAVNRYLPNPAEYRDRMTFDGQSFAEWSERLLTELNPAKRVEGVRAMKAFGTQGYGPEATGILLSILDGFPVPEAQHKSLGDVQPNEHEQELLVATFEALVHTAPHGRVAIQQALRERRGYARHMAAIMLTQLLVPDEADVMTLVAMLDSPEPEAFRVATGAFAGIELTTLPLTTRKAVLEAIRRSLTDPARRPLAIELLDLFDAETPREWARVVSQTDTLTKAECVALIRKMPEVNRLDQRAVRDLLKIVPRLGQIQSRESIFASLPSDGNFMFSRLMSLGSAHQLLAELLAKDDATREELETIVKLVSLSDQTLSSDDPLVGILRTELEQLPDDDPLRGAISRLLPSQAPSLTPT